MSQLILSDTRLYKRRKERRRERGREEDKGEKKRKQCGSWLPKWLPFGCVLTDAPEEGLSCVFSHHSWSAALGVGVGAQWWRGSPLPRALSIGGCEEGETVGNSTPLSSVCGLLSVRPTGPQRWVSSAVLRSVLSGGTFWVGDVKIVTLARFC